MPILTSLVLFLTGLALITALLKARPKARVRRLEDWEENKMEIAARICQAAAREGFGVHLDTTDASLIELDRILTEGWKPAESILSSTVDTFTREASPLAETSGEATTVPSERQNTEEMSDTLFVLASYVGNVLVQHHKAEWRLDAKTHKWPFVHFKEADLSASPFEIVQKKLASPTLFDLADAERRLLAEVERRKHVRVTSWHSTGNDAVSFRPETTGAMIGGASTAEQNDAVTESGHSEIVVHPAHGTAGSTSDWSEASRQIDGAEADTAERHDNISPQADGSALH